MKPEERIALDALEQVGITGLSMWHLRCLAAFLSTLRQCGGWPKVTEYDTPRAWAENRYKCDLQTSSMDAAHGFAEWEDAEWIARRTTERHEVRRRQLGPLPEPFQEALT